MFHVAIFQLSSAIIKSLPICITNLPRGKRRRNGVGGLLTAPDSKCSGAGREQGPLRLRNGFKSTRSQSICLSLGLATAEGRPVQSGGGGRLLLLLKFHFHLARQFSWRRRQRQRRRRNFVGALATSFAYGSSSTTHCPRFVAQLFGAAALAPALAVAGAANLTEIRNAGKRARRQL